MSATAYRGVSYDAQARQFNQLALIKKQLEKIERTYQAQLANTKLTA